MFSSIIGGVIFFIFLPCIIPRHHRISYYACYISFFLYLSSASFLLIPFFMLNPNRNENRWWGSVIALFEAKILGIKFEMKNTHLAKKEGNGIIVMNHLSMFDVLLVGRMNCFLGGVTTVIKKELLFLGPLGLILWLTNFIFIDRRNREAGIKNLNQGVVDYLNGNKTAKVIIFPEGTRNKTGKGLLPFKKGAFRLAINNKLPIIPVVQSPYYFIKKNASFTTGKKIICFLKPIETTHLTLEDIDTLMEITKQQMEHEYMELEDEIECLSNI